MHILLIHQAFAALNEAGGTRHYEMAEYLAGQGHQVTIIASPVSYLSGKRRSNVRWADKQTPQPGITIIRSYTLPVLHRNFVLRVFSFFSFMFSSFIEGIKVPKVDLVWGTSPPIFQGLTAWALARLKGVPFLFEVRDLWPAFAIAVGVLKNPLLIRLSEGLERFLYRHADQVMVNSPGYLGYVQERGAKKVALIPNGADPAMFAVPVDSAGTLRQKYSLTGKFVVLYAGAHGLSNDLDVLLDAAVRLRSQPHIHFLFVGDGKEKPALQQRVAAEALTNVTFMASVPKTEMAGVLAMADVCVAILKPIEMYKTTYPNKVFDYMAAGKPVLLAIDGVIREVVESNQAGIAVPPGNPQALADGIMVLASHPDEARAMGQAGRNAIIQSFNRAHFSQEFELLLKDLR
jgi:glycosyltransferase involved in cell wall biosynthesis